MATMNPVTDEYKEEEDEKKSDPLHEVLEQYKVADEYWADDRRMALEDIKFRNGEQWYPEDLQLRKNRPCLTVDKLNQYVRQIVNDGRQNRPAIKVRPVDSMADTATANVFSGIIKHIEENSGADAVYDTALDSAATGGMGYFRVLTEYCNDESFEQEIVIKRIRNPLSVLTDPSAEAADFSDMKFCFIVEQMDKDKFEAKYPNKRPEDFKTNDKYQDWYGESVRIAEYWCVKEEDRTLYMMADGSVTSKARLDELRDAGIEVDSLISETRNIPVRKVYRGVCCGSDWLEPLKEWPGQYIPVLVVPGNEIDVEGKVTHSGIIRPAKDAQRLYNYSRSAFAERVALTPKAPWVAAEGQVEAYEHEWNTANTENYSVLRYTPTSINGTPVPPPQRQGATDIPSGFAQDMQISEHDIQGAIGMYAASLGAPSNERSGKAIMARQREGDTGTFHYHDNLNRAIRHCGRILVDLIPKIYDSNRVVRILGYDGKSSDVTIDPTIPTASKMMGVKTIYNLGVGRYDVSISAGPSYNTLRQEAAESMVQMVQANPALMQVIGDLMVKNMDWPGAEEISDRLRMTLPPEIRQAEEDKKVGNMPPEVAQMKAQMDKMMQQKDQAINAASDKIEQLMAEVQSLKEANDVKLQEAAIKQQEANTDAEIKAAELRIKAEEVDIQRFEAETARILAEAQLAAAHIRAADAHDLQQF